MYKLNFLVDDNPYEERNNFYRKTCFVFFIICYI